MRTAEVTEQPVGVMAGMTQSQSHQSFWTTSWSRSSDNVRSGTLPFECERHGIPPIGTPFELSRIYKRGLAKCDRGRTTYRLITSCICQARPFLPRRGSDPTSYSQLSNETPLPCYNPVLASLLANRITAFEVSSYRQTLNRIRPGRIGPATPAGLRGLLLPSDSTHSSV